MGRVRSRRHSEVDPPRDRGPDVRRRARRGDDLRRPRPRRHRPPIHLADAQNQAWGEILGDYEIVPPFEQLGRPIYGLEPGEENATVLNRRKDVQIPATTLVGTLERLAWVRGQPQDAGIFYLLSAQQGLPRR
jgi:hypothetical protein